MGFDRIKNSLSKVGDKLLNKVADTIDDVGEVIDRTSQGKIMKVDNSTKVADIDVNKIVVPTKTEGEIVVLAKGANMNLSDDIVTTPIACGIEWDEVKVGPDFDADVSCILVDNDGANELIYFGTPKTDGKILSKCKSVFHTGDNLTGADDAVPGVATNEDDETIFVKLSDLPASVDKVVFLINIYGGESKGQTFGTTSTMQARLYDVPSGNVFMEADLMENNATNRAMVVGEFYRNESGWKYKNLSTGSNDSSLQKLVDAYK